MSYNIIINKNKYYKYMEEVIQLWETVNRKSNINSNVNYSTNSDDLMSFDILSQSENITVKNSLNIENKVGGNKSSNNFYKKKYLKYKKKYLKLKNN